MAGVLKIVNRLPIQPSGRRSLHSSPLLQSCWRRHGEVCDCVQKNMAEANKASNGSQQKESRKYDEAYVACGLTVEAKCYALLIPSDKLKYKHYCFKSWTKNVKLYSFLKSNKPMKPESNQCSQFKECYCVFSYTSH